VKSLLLMFAAALLPRDLIPSIKGKTKKYPIATMVLSSPNSSRYCISSTWQNAERMIQTMKSRVRCYEDSLPYMICQVLLSRASICSQSTTRKVLLMQKFISAVALENMYRQSYPTQTTRLRRALTAVLPFFLREMAPVLCRCSA